MPVMNIEQARILRVEELTTEYRTIVLDCPSIAAEAEPGQFVHLLIPNLQEATLRRPFSIFKVDNQTLSLLYKIVGRGTHAMSLLEKGGMINLMGPLGNGFPMPDKDAVPVLVAGGYGVAPLSFLAERLGRPGTVFVGGATSDDILCMGEFEKLNWEIHIATENGSAGEKGLVTDIFDAWLEERKNQGGHEIYACGPDGMLKAICERAVKHGWRGWISLDKHMGCGVGACLACVQKLKMDDGTVERVRVCRDGPVFEAGRIIWN